MSHRVPQIESTLRRVISQVLARKLSDPRLEGLISVTRVAVAPDLRQATVSISVLPAKFESRAIHALQHAAVHIHRLVCQEVKMRIVPHLEFRLDGGLKKESKVQSAIRRGLDRRLAQEADGSAPIAPPPAPLDSPDSPARPSEVSSL